ncbi:MAG TPA: maleylpyruvate isomerase N-terminal domain-containing protein [Pseudonocardiaceae bacterium]|nr:maleylpyruvate isomerase N-terminal domain-containing protein [Pseudonocardiaceae bacterium]
MVTQVTKADWQQGLDALREEVSRVTALLRSSPDPAAPAVGTWNLGEVALHLAQYWLILTSLARQDLSRVYTELPEVAGASGGPLLRNIWDLADMTVRGVKSDPERDLGALADRLDAEAQRYFTDCAGADPAAPCPWLVEGITLPLSAYTYHLLNETLIHGRDIALAAGRKWPIERTHAAMALGQFVVPLFKTAPPRTFTTAEAAGVRATYDVRLRGAGSFYFVFDDGGFSVEEPSYRTVDCHISADPLALLLVAFGRQSQWTAIAQTKLMAWGRKPWLGLQLRSFLRNP